MVLYLGKILFTVFFGMSLHQKMIVFYLYWMCWSSIIFKCPFSLPLPRLKVNLTPALCCCKPEVAQTEKPFQLVQHGEKLGPSADSLGPWAYSSVLQLPHSAIFSFLLWTLGDVGGSSGLSIAFRFSCVFSSTEFSSPAFTFLTHVISLPPLLPLCPCLYLGSSQPFSLQGQPPEGPTRQPASCCVSL